jgi:hypothetical protein
MDFLLALANELVVEVCRAQKQPAMHGVSFRGRDFIPVEKLQLVSEKNDCLAFQFSSCEPFCVANPGHQHRAIMLPQKHPRLVVAVLRRFCGFVLVGELPFEVLFR